MYVENVPIKSELFSKVFFCVENWTIKKENLKGSLTKSKGVKSTKINNIHNNYCVDNKRS